jgi:hypothetical protein
MSLLEATTQQVVYGPDGKAYGNPAIARNAGVNQYYREDGTPYPVATPAAVGMGNADPYSQIMGQMGYGSDPYSRIMAQMTPTMNPYTGAGVAIGGYDPALYNRRSGSGLINTGRGGGGGAGGAGGSGGGSGGFESVPSAWDNMTPAQQAAYYAANPNMAAITQFGQKAFGFTTPGMVQNYFVPEFVANMSARAMGYDPANLSYGGASRAEQDAMNAALAAQSMQSMQDALNADTAAAQAQSISDQSSAGSEAGGYGTGDTSGGFGEGQYNMGGPVDRVGGPNPPGPDDGAGMLQLGEYVIKKSAVKKYGQGLLDMINAGKIPAKKMKSLLG